MSWMSEHQSCETWFETQLNDSQRLGIVSYFASQIDFKWPFCVYLLRVGIFPSVLSNFVISTKVLLLSKMLIPLCGNQSRLFRFQIVCFKFVVIVTIFGHSIPYRWMSKFTSIQSNLSWLMSELFVHYTYSYITFIKDSKESNFRYKEKQLFSLFLLSSVSNMRCSFSILFSFCTY